MVLAAVVQMSSQGDLAANLVRVEALVAASASRGAQIVLLPENFALMGEEAQRREIAERVDASSPGPIVAALQRAANRSGVTVVAGGFPERSEDATRPYNTSLVVDAEGAIIASYRKIHLFDVDVGDGVSYRESSATTRGEQPVVALAHGLRIGLSICYDVRFPELYRALVDRDAQVLTVPAAFTLATGKDHWHVLLRARAIESQAYVLAAAQWGSHPRNRRTYGKSCIIDPWGDVLAQAPEGEGFAVAEIDPERIAAVRRDLPSLQHRRLGVSR
jgi:predicted amidohydrolase